MKKKIYKYTLRHNEHYLELPKDSTILSAIAQRNSIVLYAMVDIEETEKEIVEYILYPTGGTVFHNLYEFTFISTVSLFEGDLIFHVFIRKG